MKWYQTVRPRISSPTGRRVLVKRRYIGSGVIVKEPYHGMYLKIGKPKPIEVISTASYVHTDIEFTVPSGYILAAISQHRHDNRCV